MAQGAESPGGATAPPVLSPSPNTLRTLLGLRLVVISTLFLGALIIQVTTGMILQLRGLYAIFLATYGLSLIYLVLYLRSVSPRLQAVVQLLGDIAIVTGFVNMTGGLYSPFSFLYLTVIVVAALLLRGGGFIFAGLSAVAYGLLVDLMVFNIIPIPPNITGMQVAEPTTRVFYQLMIHVGGFILVAFLVSYMTESLRTAHHRLEEETERAKQFVALTDHVVRSMGAGIVAVDLEGHVLHLNPAGGSILGVEDVDQAIGLAIDCIMPLRGHDWGLLWTRARVRPISRLEERLGSTETRLGLSIGPLRDERGSLVGFVVNFQDLSEVESEAENRRLQERMAAVGEMSARMAHEIKNPLASISGSAQVLATVGGMEVNTRRLLSIVVDESQRLSSILDGFLNYTRPVGSTKAPVEVTQLLRDGADLLKRSAEIRSEHRVILDLPSELVVMGDADLLRQVFWNLSRNAIQAMADGGELVISGYEDSGMAHLEWRDTGIGMPEEIRKRAFEPFVTAHPGGTGLGLAVVYAALDEHGGTVEIDSSPGQGTKVTVELPCFREVP